MRTKLQLHGPITIAPDKKHFCHADGTPFFYFADTLWYAMSVRTSWTDFQTIICHRAQMGFTAVQVVIGVPPEIPIDSPFAASATGMPFVRRANGWELNTAYFDEVDRRMQYIVDQGMAPVVFGGWGPHIDILGVTLIKDWWSELITRYGKFPVLWCLCGEVDLFVHLASVGKQVALAQLVQRVLPTPLITLVAKGKRLLEHLSGRATNSSLAVRLAQWSAVGEHIEALDAPNHLTMIHVSARVSAASYFPDSTWLDIDTIQSGHSEDSMKFYKKALDTWVGRGRPFLNLEPWYEGIFGKYGKEAQLEAFALSRSQGAAGHAYGAHGLWNMATSEDPFLAHWGKSDWKTALEFPGAAEIAKLVRSGAWERLSTRVGKLS